jgi:hypothetical protein
MRIKMISKRINNWRECCEHPNKQCQFLSHASFPNEKEPQILHFNFRLPNR